MKIFDHPAMESWECPICRTNEDKPVTLIPIHGTREGNMQKAEQVHVECLCLELTILPYGNIAIYMKEEL